MKQKIVIKVQMHCDKCRTKALKIAAVANGVISVAISGKDKDQVVVTGEGIDSANLTCLLRKKLGYAAIISVAEDKSKDDQDKKPHIIGICTSSSAFCSCPHCTLYYAKPVYDAPNPPICSIM